MLDTPNCYARGCLNFLGVKQDRENEETERVTCRAYPNGIPAEITYGEELHLTPLPGDHGIQYQAPPEEAIEVS